MKLTDEQKESLERQRRDSPGEPLRIELTPEQREEFQRTAQREEAGREENIAWLRKLEAAAAEPGFSGDLRRALLTSPLGGRRDLSAELGVDRQTLDSFQIGEGSLPFAAVDRLVELLGLRLVSVD